jgi:hypothetical protein
MKKNKMMVLGLALTLVMVLAASPVSSYQKEDNLVLLNKIAGIWEYVAGYDILEVKFFVEDGTLKGAELGDDRAVDCEQDNSNPNLFSGYTPDGEGFEVEFFKDEEGKYTKSKLLVGMQEVEGTKVIEK